MARHKQKQVTKEREFKVYEDPNDDLNINQRLTAAKQTYLNNQLKGHTERLAKRWRENIEPKMRDYLNGLTANEVGEKYNLPRTLFYGELRRTGLPLPVRIRTWEAKKIAFKLADKQKHSGIPNEIRDAIMMDKCKCLTCLWIRRRLILKARLNDCYIKDGEM